MLLFEYFFYEIPSKMPRIMSQNYSCQTDADDESRDGEKRVQLPY